MCEILFNKLQTKLICNYLYVTENPATTKNNVEYHYEKTVYTF